VDPSAPPSDVALTGSTTIEGFLGALFFDDGAFVVLVPALLLPLFRVVVAERFALASAIFNFGALFFTVARFAVAVDLAGAFALAALFAGAFFAVATFTALARFAGAFFAVADFVAATEVLRAEAAREDVERFAVATERPTATRFSGAFFAVTDFVAATRFTGAFFAVTDFVAATRFTGAFLAVTDFVAVARFTGDFFATVSLLLYAFEVAALAAPPLIAPNPRVRAVTNPIPMRKRLCAAMALPLFLLICTYFTFRDVQRASTRWNGLIL
jgi:hypothetical protein